MLKLLPLVVVTGAIRVDGGITKRTLTPDRKRAAVIITDYSRKLRRKRLLKTPYGVLFDAASLAELKTLLSTVTKAIAEFNAGSMKCKLTNCLIWERLTGNRLGAVEGWIAARLADNDEKVCKALASLQGGARASSPSAPAALV